MTIRSRELAIAEWRGAKAVSVGRISGHVLHAAEVIEQSCAISFARSDLRDGDVVELVVAECGSSVTDRAFESEKGLRALELLDAQRFVIAGEKLIPGRVVERVVIDA